MQWADRVFAVDGEEYGWCEVVVAAARTGAWASAEQRARVGAAAVAHAAAIGDALAPGVLDAAARDFRYARDLLTAESLERWLGDRGLSAKEWSAFLHRSAQRLRFGSEAEALLERYPITTEDAARLTVNDVVCSGELGDWKRALAGRVAAVASLGSRDRSAAPADTASLEDLFPALSHLGVNRDDVQAATRRVQSVDDAFEHFRSTQVTDATVRDYVGRRRLEWVQFDCRVMAFPEENMAAEAALLLREDGMGFTGVYAAAAVEPRVARFCLEDVPAATRDEFLAARAGDLVGPTRLGDEYALYLIREKILPSARDPEVRRRAEEGVLQHALRQQLDRRVRWLAD